MIPRFAVFVALLALPSAGTAPAPAGAQGGPIKIGLLVPLTGAASALGKDMQSGTELYLDEINRQVSGRKIELIVEDTEGVTATALTKARKLVDQDHVAILTGGLLASTGYALHPFADAAKIPTTYPGHVLRRPDPAEAGQVGGADRVEQQPVRRRPSASGSPRTSSTRRSPPSASTTPSAGRSVGGLPAHVRGERRADRSRRSGRR